MKKDRHDPYRNPYYSEMGSSGTTPEDHQSSSASAPTSSWESPSSSSSDHGSPTFDSKGKPAGDDLVAGPNKKKKLEKKANSFVYRISDHVKMGPKLSETVKGKLSLGAKIIRKGGREKIFRHIFGVSEGEELLKASQCYLSTTAGPIAGILFISTEKIAFCSERKISLFSPTGGVVRSFYKVIIPVRKIERANESANTENPAQKYIEIVTVDGFEFWFMGFVRYEKAFHNIQKAISMPNKSK